MNHKNPKTLIIGTHGQLGNSFRKFLVGLTNVTFTDLEPQDSTILKLDLTDSRALSSLVEDLKPDIIINCAAYTAVDRAETEIDMARKINAEALQTIGRSAKKVGAIVIHYSTDYVFNGEGERPWLESDQPNPVNAYGQTKLDGELALTRETPLSYIFRTQWVYDKTGKNFVNTMLRLGAEREELTIVGDQIGAPTSSDVIAQSTLKALPGILAGTMPPGIYNLACRGEVSWYDFAEEIFRQARKHGHPVKVKLLKKIETKDFPTPARRPKNSRLNLEKFEKAIDGSLPDWKDALSAVFNQ